MKKIITLFILTFFLCGIAPIALAFPNEPNGFRSLPWGTSFKKFKSKYPNYRQEQAIRLYGEEEDTDDYSVDFKNDSISNVPIIRPIRYTFFKNKLFSVNINLIGSTPEQSKLNESSILEVLSALYGPCLDEFHSDIMDGYAWDGSISRISLIVIQGKDSKNIGLINLHVLSTEIQKEYISHTKALSQKSMKQGW